MTSTKSKFPLSHYSSFNDFFIRRLKPGARPCDPEPKRLCCPADGKVLVYPQIAAEDVLPVKSNQLAARELLAEAIDPTPYHGGAALVVRLAPYDYHRFHFPADGQVGQTQWIDGSYHSVNPIALARRARRFPPQSALRLRTDDAHLRQNRLH